MFVFGDIGGRFDALMRLIDKIGVDGPFVFVGDLNDRGEQSKQVIEWAMKSNHIFLHSNHGHMMVDWYRKTGIYGSDIWFMNGGLATLRSYGDKDPYSPDKRDEIPLEHIEWLESRPLYYENDKVFISHAPWMGGQTLEYSCDLSAESGMFGPIRSSLLWNRYNPPRRDKFQIFGHNHRLEIFEDKDGPYAACCDDDLKKVVTAIHYPTLEVFQEQF